MSGLNRRDFLGLAAGAVLSRPGSILAQHPDSSRAPLRFTNAANGVGPFTKSDGAKSPDIFLISADMVSPDLYHPDRPLSKHVRIPNIRSLMEDGTFFTNAFCTVPLCSPSRASYLTGRYSYIQGNGERAPQGLETRLRPSDIIFPEYLHASGYAARHVGKAHVGTEKFTDAFGQNDQPWDRWSPPIYDDDDYLTYQRALGVKPQKYSREIIFLQQDRRTPGNSAGGWIVQEDGNPFPLEAHYSFYLATLAANTLQDLVQSTQTGRRPVYLQLDIFDPHQPFSIPAGFEQREAELRAVVSLPESYERVRERNFARSADEPEIIDIYRKYWGIYEPETLLNYHVAYILQMELVDQAIGKFLDQVRKLGLYENATIAFISDHGEMNGRQALVDKGVYHHPDVLRVPLVLKTAGGTRNQMRHEPVSLLDLSQTLLEAAGIRAEAKADGVSVLGSLRGQPVPSHENLLFFGGWHVGVNFACGLARSFPEGRFLLYSYNCTSQQDELYDMNAVDPVNLIRDPAYAVHRTEMIRALGGALQSDQRWTGYWAEFRIARYNELPKKLGDMQLFTVSS